MKKANYIIQKILSISLILIMTMTYLNILGMVTITYAIDIMATNNDNVEFNAYFSVDNEKLTEINKSIDDNNLKLNIEVSVKNEGYFEGKIAFENLGFKLKEEISNQYVEKIENDIIYLKLINSEETAKIEVGIEYFKQNDIKLSSLNSPTIINLMGTYHNSKKNEEILGQREVKINWVAPENTEAELYAKLLTNKIYRYEKENKRIVQILVADGLKDNSYPVKSTEIIASIPEGARIREIHKRTTKATNGDKEFTEQNYRIEEDKVIINLENPEIDGIISWKKNTKDILVLTYEMPESFNIEETKINIEGKINAYDNNTFLAEKQEVDLNQEIEEIVTASKEEQETSIYKGKLYTGEEREYNTYTKVYIDNSEMVNNLKIIENESEYITTQYDTLTSNIEYKNIQFNEQNIKQILGNDWKIKLIEQNGKENIITNTIINQDNEQIRIDENGIITFYFEEGVKSLTIETSKTYNNGILEIHETKKIKENNYEREILKELQKIKGSTEIIYQSEEEKSYKFESEIDLKETETKASLEISKSSLVDTNTNENIEIIAKLETNGENLNLYKEPNIEIVFPEEVSKIDVLQAKALYENSLEIENNKMYRKEDGRLALYVKFKGEQLIYDSNGGTELHLFLNIDIDKLEQNKNSLIEMNYTNENDGTNKSEVKEIMMYANAKLIEPQLLKAAIATGLEADIVAKKGLADLQDGDEVYEGETIKYSLTLKNNSGIDYRNIQVNATQTNGKVWDLVKVQLYNAMGEEVEPEDMYRLTDKNTISFSKIDILKNGETIKLEYDATPDKLQNETTKTTYGTISIVSEENNLNKTIKTPENTIKKAEFELQIKEANTRNAVWKDDNAILCNIYVTNLTEKTIENAELKVICSKNLGYDKYAENTTFLELFDWDDVISIKNIEKNELGQPILTLQISKIEPKETMQILDMPCVTDFNYDKDFEYVNMLAYLETSENNRYYSNIMNRAVYNGKVNINLSQKVYNDGKEIKENEKIDSSKEVQFVITIENKEDKNIPIRISDTLPPLGVEIKEIKLETENEITDITKDVNGSVLYTLAELLPKKTITVKINTKIKTGIMSSDIIENDVMVDVQGKDQKIYSSFKFNTDKELQLNDNDDNNDNVDENDKNKTDDGNNNIKPSTNEKYTITGIAWVDSNKNGQRDSNEETQQGLKVRVMNLDTKKIENSIAETSEDGTYTLEVPTGKYIVIFNYDNNKYSLTTYQAKQVSSTSNSDVVAKNIKINGQEENVAVTDELTITENMSNIDIGLITKERFDLKLEKYVSKITISNKEGTKTYNYNDLKLAKAEIKSKYIQGTIAIIEYKIKVKNVGDVAGYAKKIVDYKPSDLKFISNINKSWHLSDTQLYTDALSKTKIEPGEEKEVTLVLTKTLTKTNTGLTSNRAEIYEDVNALGIDDINSTPGNQNSEENDLGQADVILTISTGLEVQHIITNIYIIMLTGVMIYCIKNIIEKFAGKENI